ncbi:MAG: SprT family zinc-dependent metalloprotease [Gammaproteobacteria bacterium]
MNASAEALQISLPLQDLESNPIPPYHLRVSTRARRMQIRVSPWRGIEVIVPRRHPRAEREAFIERNRDWMFRQWQEICREYDDAINILPPETITLPAMDKTWSVKYVQGPRRRVREMRNALEIYSPGNDPGPKMETLRKWLASTARQFLALRLRRFAVQHRFRYRKLQIRGQDGRWGSCTSNSTITLNYKLLFLAIETVDYLLVHELCHTRFLDHSRAYWQLVSEIEPDYDVLEKRLDDAWHDVPGWANRNP